MDLRFRGRVRSTGWRGRLIATAGDAFDRLTSELMLSGLAERVAAQSSPPNGSGHPRQPLSSHRSPLAVWSPSTQRGGPAGAARSRLAPSASRLGFLQAKGRTCTQSSSTSPSPIFRPRRAELDELVPRVSSAPGFVAGYWITLPEGKGTSTMVFDSEESAKGLVGIDAERPPDDRHDRQRRGRRSHRARIALSALPRAAGAPATVHRCRAMIGSGAPAVGSCATADAP